MRAARAGRVRADSSNRRPRRALRYPAGVPLEPSPALRALLRPTTLVRAPRLARHLGVDLFLAAETFQETGSFKFRAGANVALSVPHPTVVTASSGNFGQALAAGCALAGRRAIVVMPATSSRVKVEAVRERGGEVVFVDTALQTRAAKVAEVMTEHPEAYLASAYDDDLVIAGNSTLGEELAALGEPFDLVLAPVGGGGLTAGIATGLARAGHRASLWGAEPQLANDAARSLAAGELLACPAEAPTLADGARTLSLGRRNWEILRSALGGIVEVPEEAIAEAVRLLFLLANLKAEPTGALPVGALLARPEPFRGRRVCCVVSGGNVDPATYARLLAGETEPEVRR